MSSVAPATFELSAKRRELLERMLRKKGVETSGPERIPRRTDKGPAPLSFTQQRLWFLHQLVPGLIAYNLTEALELEGDLDAGALGRSLNALVDRHEVLRTHFSEVDGKAAQIVSPRLEISLPAVDLEGLGAEASDREARRRALEIAQTPFDLTRPPLLRLALIRLGERRHVLVLVLHHNVSDGWSMGILVKEVTALYQAFVAGRSAELPELPIQFADFAHWQRRRLDEVLEEQVDYWNRHLEGAPRVLDLATDRPRPPLQSFRGAKCSFRLPAPLAEGLRRLSRREGRTLFMALLAAFGALLRHYTGQRDVLVGTPVANRNRPETEGLIGFFVNTLVLRLRLDGRLTFRELLAQAGETVLGADRHQDMPVEKLLDEMRLERDLSRNPLFQVMFTFHNFPLPEAKMPGLALRSFGLQPATTPFDLNLNLGEDGAELGGLVEYGTDLFDATTVRRLTAHLRAVLEAAVADPDVPLAALRLPGPAARHQALAEWNDTATALPGGTLHGLFEVQAERRPTATAVVFGDESWTYRELDRRANRLARLLRERGVERGSRVAVFVRRSAEMVAALLAILKAGGTYVPLETSFPAARLRFILSSLGIRCLVTDSSRLDRLHGLWDDLPDLEHVVLLDEADAEAVPKRIATPADAARVPAEDLGPVSEPGDLAYIIFTSGSTGTPKGVVVRHRPAVNLVRWVNRTFDVGAGDRVLFITSLCFDLSVYDVFGLLATGGSIRVAAEADVREPAALVRLLEAGDVTFWDSAPAALQQLVAFFPQGAGGAATSAPRLVFLSGDWIPVALPDQVRATFPTCRFISLGGATEATVWSNFHPVGRVPSHWTSIPYGRPIDNARYHILSSRLECAPAGVGGDLLIGGRCLASVYTDARQTAEKFIPDPFAAPPGARLYRTGDRARFWADGTMEFLGRLDHQVKIRGFRIELGEIETVLAEHPEVQAAVVLTWDDESGHKRIVAYVVARGGAAPKVEELRAYLTRNLPDYMVPAVFVPLDALPVTANGKLDRRALPAPDASRPELDDAFVAPRTAAEEKLAAIWCRVLGLGKVGVHDNFFHLGGDSILSVQITARARQEGLDITPRQLFEHQTVAELAAVAGQAPAARAEQGLVTGEVPVTPIQSWFFEQDGGRPHHFNQAVLLEARRPLDEALLEATLQRIVVHHDALRFRFFQEEERRWRQVGVEPDDRQLCLEIDLGGLGPGPRSAALERAAAWLHASLDLSNGPLLRAAFFRFADPGPHRLLIVAHHLAVDGVSWRILLQDLEGVYRRLENGETPELPAKTTSFKAWAEHLERYSRSPEVRREREVWLAPARLQAAPLPRDFPAAERRNVIATSESVARVLEGEPTRALLQEVPEAYGTRIDEVLLTALARCLTSWTGSERLLVDLEGHGREDLFDDVDLSHTVGWFTALFPALLELPGGAGVAEGLKSVKEQLRRLPRHGLGYGALRYGAADESVARELRALPAAEVSFNYFGQLDAMFSDSELFAPAEESSGPPIWPGRRRTHVLEVSGLVLEGRLRISWTFSRGLHRRATIEELADRFTTELHDILRHCSSSDAVGYTPSDFGDVDLDQEELEAVLGEVGWED